MKQQFSKKYFFDKYLFFIYLNLGILVRLLETYWRLRRNNLVLKNEVVEVNCFLLQHFILVHSVQNKLLKFQFKERQPLI